MSAVGNACQTRERRKCRKMPDTGKRLKRSAEQKTLQEPQNGKRNIQEPRPRKFNLPLSYIPKIPGVRDGTIRQTIRRGTRYKVGDRIRFHGWEGKPYRSGWVYLTDYMTLNEVYNIHVFSSKYVTDIGYPVYWTSMMADELARLDGIVPPTGVALGNLIAEMHGIFPEGMPMQILRWLP
jgi:hypothetical protein